MGRFLLGIDAAVLSKPGAGMGRYLIEVCKRLDTLLPEARFVVYTPSPLLVELPSARWVTRQEGTSLARLGSSYAWLKLCVSRLAKSDRVDVFWAPRTILPARSRAFLTVCTVHDLNYRLFPMSMPYATRWAHRLWFARDIRRADAVVANSQGTARRLRGMLGVEVAAVATPGVAESFTQRTPARISTQLKALGVTRPYFLGVGTLEPRKNLPALIEAFISLKRDGNLAAYDLIIVGNRGWRNGTVRSQLRAARAWGVRWFGFVSDAELAALYSGATAFVFPSVYEGFGIPALEATACGTRVIASDVPELREAGGPEGTYVAPTVSGIRAGLLSALEAPPPSHPHPQNWMDAAQTMADLFEVLSRRHAKGDTR